MKKLLLVIGLVASAFSLSAQNDVNGRIITHSTATQTMVWSESDQKNIYFDKQERHPEDNLVEISLDSKTASGKVVITNINDGDAFTFIIYDYEFRPDQKTPEGVLFNSFLIDCVESSTGTKARMVWLSYQNAEFRMISVFMPSEQLAVHMDTDR